MDLACPLCKFVQLMYAIFKQFALVAGIASRVHKLTYYFSSLVEQLLKLSTICKSSLHGPSNHVDQMRTLIIVHAPSCYRAKLKCNIKAGTHGK